MKLFKYTWVFLSSFLCQAVKHSFAETHPTNDPLRAEATVLQETIHRDVYVHNLAGKCNWTLRMPGNGHGDGVPLTADYADFMIERVCQEAGCGGVYSVDKKSSLPNATCFHSCAYAHRRLLNCSESTGSSCTVISAVACGNQAVRLSGGSDRCAGRVELWRDGQWGTVCDDQWELRDAGVVCKQLGCGYALSVTGQGGAFPAGRGPVYRDDLNCSGQEENLWLCPASEDKSDCGHKEDAGVVCSEMRSVRLSGGLDRCSGKVEVHRNGTWGTICNNCWNKDMAAMVCSMLHCGHELVDDRWFIPHIAHNIGPLYYYQCGGRERSLWQCLELINNPFVCVTSKASGVVCSGSLGFRKPTTPTVTEITNRPTATTALPAVAADDGSVPQLCPELLITITVSLLLLVLLTASTALCCHYRRRHAFLLQQKPVGGQRSPGIRHNDYKYDVNLVKVTANSHRADGLPTARCLATQLGVDSAPVDSDFQQYNPRNGQTVSLSTFQNSQRYRTDVKPLMKPPVLHGFTEEGRESQNAGTEAASARHDYGTAFPQYVRGSVISVDSFDDSSTSSEECYENVTNNPGLGQSPATVSDSLIDSQNQLESRQAADLQSSDDEDDYHVYSPVSPE